ncbi:probable aspartic protease At2g35615 [Tripterygium wilfordii]|uniref:probable aspartic protease At2g35615 n=1 Tax=Tripterygium wilfordii TaxID=458696 RepID=UPI0018F83E8A|nr:probable aspartic protease At2g35615 [Tripterygium wilfordii]
MRLSSHLFCPPAVHSRVLFIVRFEVLGIETIYIASSIGKVISFPASVFGCGHQNHGKYSGLAQGVVGLGGGLLSLVSQLKPKIEYKFSYCLLPWDAIFNSKIRFGHKAKTSNAKVVSTPMINKHPATFYYVSLKSITIGNNRRKMSRNPGNIIIDSGTTLTMLHSSMYKDLEDIVKKEIGISPIPDPTKVLSLCYRTRSVLDINFPEMIFHFNGANLRLPPTNIFLEYHNLYCMMIVPNDRISICGRISQANFQVEYDILNRQVSFVSADCSIF